MPGLSIASVISILSDLIRMNLIIESGEGISTGGRKPTLYSLNCNDIFVAGIELHQNI